MTFILLWLSIAFVSAQDAAFSIAQKTDIEPVSLQTKMQLQAVDSALNLDQNIARHGFLKSNSLEFRKGSYSVILFPDISMVVNLTDSVMSNNGRDVYKSWRGKIKGSEKSSDVLITYVRGTFRAEIRLGNDYYTVWPVKGIPNYCVVVKASNIPVIY
jgi:hypothetical protein